MHRRYNAQRQHIIHGVRAKPKLLLLTADADYVSIARHAALPTAHPLILLLPIPTWVLYPDILPIPM